MDRTAIITGFGPGLSKELAVRLLAQGYRVGGISRSGRFGAAFEAENAGFANYAADVGDRAALAGAVAACTERFGAPSLLVHNAAELAIRDFLELAPDDFERIWRTSCLGAVNSAQLVLPRMLEAGQGTLIFTGATASLKGGAKFSAFASAKFALRGLAQSLARAYGPRGVHVAHVVIDGVIWGERAEKTFGMAKEACVDPSDVVDTFVALLNQKPSAWTHEIDLRPSVERF